MVYVIQILLTACEQDQNGSRSVLLLLRVQRKIPDDGQRNCTKHVEFYSKNKFEKLVHLVGFITGKYGNIALFQCCLLKNRAIDGV